MSNERPVTAFILVEISAEDEDAARVQMSRVRKAIHAVERHSRANFRDLATYPREKNYVGLPEPFEAVQEAFECSLPPKYRRPEFITTELGDWVLRKMAESEDDEE